MAAGVPSATTRPRSSTTMRSHSRSASSTSWVTSTTVVPASRTRRTTSQVWRRPTGSRFWVSSSRNTSSGRPTRARATKSRWRSPPDSAREGPAPQLRRAATPSASSSRGRGVGVERGEQPQRLADPHPVGQGGVLELRADAPAEPVAGGGRVEPEHRDRRRRRPGAAPAGSRRWWSCRRRWCRGGRTARRGARRTRRRAAPRWRRSCRRRSRTSTSASTSGRVGWCGGGGRRGGHGPIVRPPAPAAHRPRGATRRSPCGRGSTIPWS